MSDSSLDYDRVRKGRLYAQDGIQEYWIVNLAAETVEVRRQPSDDGWDNVLVVHRGETIVPLVLPEFPVAVHDILP